MIDAVLLDFQILINMLDQRDQNVRSPCVNLTHEFLNENLSKLFCLNYRNKKNSCVKFVAFTRRNSSYILPPSGGI